MTELKQLKEKIDGEEINNMKIDEKLLKRYLRAHKTVEAAHQKILATDKWRGQPEVSSITVETPGVIRVTQSKISVLLNERDTKQRPVVYVAVRNHSIYNRDVEDMTKYIIYMLEASCGRCLEDGLDNLCILFDMKNFSLTAMDYVMVKTLFNILTDHYPERLGTCLVLDAPFIFNMCWTIIKSWLDDNTASKIFFIKSLDGVKPYLDPSILPRDM